MCSSDLWYPGIHNTDKEGCNNEENRTGGHGFTSGVSPKKTNMLGEQIIAGQLINHERITILL